MAACANGASVRPTWTAGDVILSVVGAGLMSVTGLAELAPFLVSDPVIGSIAAQGLCSLNPDDPGDFQLSYLASPTTPGDLPSPLSQTGTMSWWIWHKTVYWFFQQVCQCNVTNAPPPAPIAISPITNYDTSVNLTSNQTQLTQIQNTLVVQDSGSKELYNGLQHISSLVGDLWVRNVPNLMDNPVPLATGQSGEGAITLPVASYPPHEYFSTNFTFIRCRVDQVGPRVGIRGSRNPRLYGVGSIFFESDGQGGAWSTTFDRTSIHYYDHTVPLPRTQIPYRLAWRLMPGNVVSFFGIGPATDNVMTSPTADTTPGWLPFGSYRPPANWTDPPIYPTPSSRRIFPVAGGSDGSRLDTRSLGVPEQVLTDIPSDREGCGCSGSV